MKEAMKCDPVHPESRLTSEARQLAAMGAWCTPEFLMRSSRSTQSIHAVAGPGPSASSTVAGYYLASPSLLAGSGQIDGLLAKLQRMLESNRGAAETDGREDLLQVWMSVERCLSDDECTRLRPALIERLFPGSTAPVPRCRNGAAQAGGQ